MRPPLAAALLVLLVAIPSAALMAPRVADAPGATDAAVPRATHLAPTFALANVATGFHGAEPTIGVTPSGAIFVTAYDTTLRSLDGGASWEAVREFDPLVVHDPMGQFDTADPMLWVDTTTGRVYVSHLYPGLSCSVQAWSDDDGATWLEKPAACGTPGVDHPKLLTGPYGADALPVSGLAYPNAVYYCYNKGVSTNCAVSHDGGVTYPIDRVVGAWPTDGCGGINGHPAAAPDGTVFVPIVRREFPVTGGVGAACDAPHVGVSTDHGLTWTMRAGPDVVGVEGLDPDMVVTPDGTAYILYQGADNLQYLARSSDRFTTWEGPWLVSAPDVTSTAFSAITARPDGGIAIAYLGTRDTDASPNVAPDHARWHLYVSFADDASWPAEEVPLLETLQVTPENDPVQIGCIWLLGGDVPCRNLLDFIDASISPDGRVHVAYTDGCLACATAAESRASEVVIAYQPGAAMAPAPAGSLPPATVKRLAEALGVAPLPDDA